MNYDEFLHTKVITAPESGFDVSPFQISPALKPHQRDAVQWACRCGRRALFESFGLGKTVQELEWVRLVVAHCGGMGLIVLPLGVRQEFLRDAEQVLHIPAPEYITHQQQAVKQGAIYLTNYERVRDGDIDPKAFTACALDETCTNLMKSAFERLQMTARSYDRVLKVARTIADLDGSDTIGPQHIAEAIQYRSFRIGNR